MYHIIIHIIYTERAAAHTHAIRTPIEKAFGIDNNPFGPHKRLVIAVLEPHVLSPRLVIPADNHRDQCTRASEYNIIEVDVFHRA